MAIEACIGSAFLTNGGTFLAIREKTVWEL